MGNSSTKDLSYRIVSTVEGEGFKKTAEEAWKATEELEKLLKAAEEADHAKVDIKAKADTGEAETKLLTLRRSAEDAGHGAGGAEAGFGQLHAGMAAVAVAALALGPALAAIPAALGGMAGAGGAVVLGLGGVMRALSDYRQASSAMGISGAQLAATAFSNAVALRNAQQAITDARRQAAMQEANSADSLISAQERLGNAEQAAQVAEQDLTRARMDATRALQAANETAATAALDVKAAQLAVQEAQHRQVEVNNSLTSTALDRAEAELAVERAQNSLIDTQTRATNATQDAARAQQLGVSGAPNVVSAERAKQNAIQSVTDAQRQLATAQRDAANAQVASAEQVAKAVQNLADTQRQQQLAAAAAAASAGQAASQFQRDMARLTPAGREFVTTLLGMRSAAHELSATAQTTMLPGFTAFLRDAGPSLPAISQGIGQIGSAFGAVGFGLAGLMQNPVFRGQLGQVLREGVGLVGQLSSGIVPMFAGITSAAAKAGPIVDGLGAGFHVLMTSGIPAFFAGLVSNAGGAGTAIGGLVKIVSSLLGPLGTVAGTISAALGPALAVLTSPEVAQALQAIGDSLGRIIVVLSPVITMFAQGLAGALRAAAPLLQATAKFLEDNHRWIVPLAGILAGVAVAWWAVNAAMDANPLVLVAGLIAGLVVGLIYCWEHFTGFRQFINQMWGDIKHWFHEGVTWVKGKLDWLVDTITGIPGKLSSIGAHLWDWLGAGLKGAVNGVVWGINQLIHGINAMTQGASDAWTWAGVPPIPNIPDIPALAGGGTVVTAGVALVGERGPELVRLGAGAQVTPNRQSAAMLSAGSSGMPDRFEATLDLRLNGQHIDTVMVEFQRQGGVSQAIATGALAAVGRAH